MKEVKKLFLSLFLVLLTTGTIPATGKTIRLLAVGNSFTQDGVEFYLHAMGKADMDTLIIGSLRIGSSALEDHWNNFKDDNNKYTYIKIDASGAKTESTQRRPSEVFTDEAWDFISFQQVSGRSGLYETYKPYLANLLEFVKPKLSNPDVKYLFHQTWAFDKDFTGSTYVHYNNDQVTMYAAITNAVQQAKVDNPALDIIVPVGTAIQNGRSSFIGDSFCRDGYHLNMQHGRFTAACTWYEILTGKSALESSYNPPSISPNHILVAKNAAHAAVNSPYEVTDLSKLLDSGVEDESITYPINLGLGGTLAAGWNTINNIKEGYKLERLMDSKGKRTNVNFEITDDFGGVNKNGPGDINIDTYTWNIPNAVSTQCFYGHGEEFSGKDPNPTGAFTLSNLDKELTYDVVAFCSNVNSTNVAEVYLKAEGTNGKTGYVNSTKNKTDLIILKNVTPTASGVIHFEVGVGPNNTNATRFFYINAVGLFPHDPDETDTGIKLLTDETKVNRIVLYDLSGRIIQQFDSKDAFLTFKKSHLKRAPYILKIETDRGSKSVKVII